MQPNTSSCNITQLEKVLVLKSANQKVNVHLKMLYPALFLARGEGHDDDDDKCFMLYSIIKNKCYH